MNIEQLKYIVEIFDTGSITAASKKLHVSQPNISQSIINLEKELNIKLFERSRTGAHATDLGVLFIEKSKVILDHLDDLQNIAQIENDSLNGTLSLMIIPIISISILSKTLNSFKSKYPGVQFEVTEDGSHHILKCVIEGIADIGIITLRSDMECDSRVHFEPLFTSKTIAYVGKNSPLADKKEISLSEVIDYPLVLFNERYSTSNHLRHLLQKYGTPNILFSSSNSDAMRNVIAESTAIGFYSDISLKTDPFIMNKDIIPLRIRSTTDVYSIYGIITRKQSFRSLLIQKFIDELKMQAELFKQLHDLPDYSKI
ncbi:LysR family transcriptional regulator [Sporosarcina obsidiansis]|uniref:LysR family transcriptional regulator n=1 Tax=Sporosarcina obsidiansis TaxID=2660748 RepID=UPI00129A6266|nr:LysR family transcriptional regulator [Sporosarcina obsidiansis]